MLREFLRYASAGAIGTAAHYALLFSLVQFARTDPVTASTSGAILGALVNYGFNHRFTFASSKAHHVSLPRYTAVALGGIVLNGVVLAGVLALGAWHYFIAQLVATATVFVAGYLVNRRWTF
jgi:putative flippase GtrA